MIGKAVTNRQLSVKPKKTERFLAFGAPVLLLVYYVAILVVADNFATGESVTAAISPVVFSEEIIDPFGSAPDRMHTKAVGDIDGDGLPDILVGGAANNKEGVYWYKNPTWTKITIAPDEPSGVGFSTDMQVGDIDDDGDLDVVIPRANDSGDVGVAPVWFENPRPTGNPETDPWIEHAIGLGGAHDVELGDLNNDGLLDVVVRNIETVTFIQIDAANDQWIRTVVNVRQHEGLALGDYDEDGDLDAAIGGRWLENPFIPSGLAAMNTLWTEWEIDTARNRRSKDFAVDINEDGKLDVIINTSESAGGELAWYEPSGLGAKGGPWIKHSIGFVDHNHSIQTGDIDLDGDLDVIVAEMHNAPTTQNVLVFYNLDGTATSWDFQVVDTDGSHNLRVIDIDLDGDLDIVGANWSKGPLSLWRNELSSLDNWQRNLIDSDRPWRAVLIDSADIDGDGLKDIVTGGWWYKNPGTLSGVWLRNDIGDPLYNMAAVFDIDGDTDLDILGTRGKSPSSRFLAWGENDGLGNFTVHTNLPAGDGDFLQGVTVGSITSSDIEIYLSWHDPTSPLQRLIVPPDPTVTVWPISDVSVVNQNEDLSQGDIDGDLDVDLLTGTQWLENDAGTWVPHDLFSPLGTPDRNELADIDKDGKLDAVVGYEAINSQGVLAWYEQGAVVTDLWTEHVISDTIVGPMSIDARDMDADGDIDVVAGEHWTSNPAGARMVVFENADGLGGTWVEHVVYTGDEHHDGAQTVDLDDDGDFDIISIGWVRDPGGVFLYENRAGAVTSPPSATADSYTLDEDTTLNEAAPGVLVNDSDPDGDPITAVLLSGVSNGSLNLNSDGSFTYTPNPDFDGVDSFSYQAADAVVFSNTVQVTLTVDPINDVPTVDDQSVNVEDGTPLDITLAGNDADGDTLTFAVTIQPLHGTLTGTEPNLTYSSDPAYVGPDSFTFTASDTTETSAPGTVQITVVPPNDPPTGFPDAYSVDEDVVLSVPAPGVLTNDTDPEGDTLSTQLVSGPSNGTLVLGADGSFTYTPVVNFNGQDSFTYQASDSIENSADTQVTITIDPENDTPVADPQLVQVNVETPTPVTLTASDFDGDPLSFTVTVQPLNGSLSGTVPDLIYTPETGYSGPDSFTFTASDAISTSAPALVQIDVAGLNAGMIGRWSFDDGTATDLSGNGNDGVINGAAFTAGQVGGGALDFDGLDDYVSVGNLNVPGTAVTVAAWINSDNLGNCGSSSDCRIFSKASGTDAQEHYLMLSTVSSSGIKLRFRLKVGGTTQTLIASTGNLVAGQWMHVAATYDGVNMRVYLDGVEVGIAASSGAIDAAPTVPIWIGGNPPDENGRPWDGRIDEVRLFERALDASEVQQLVADGADDVTVSGTLALQGVAAGTAGFTAISPTVTLDSGTGPQVVLVSPVDGSFSLAVANGTYTITASGPGFIAKQRVDLVASDTNISMPQIQLYGGLVDQDSVVSGSDLSTVLGAIGLPVVDRTNGSDSNLIDVNADGFVTGLDSSLVATSFSMVSPQLDW